MTARSAAAIASLVLRRARRGGCTSFYEIPIETPIQPKMDVSAFQRVLSPASSRGGTEDVDANLETVRLLRSQLRIEVGAARDRSRSAAARRDRRGSGQARRGRRRRTAGGAADGARRRAAGQQPQPRCRADPQREGSRELPAHLRRRRVLEEARRGIPEPADRHRHGALHAASGPPAS